MWTAKRVKRFQYATCGCERNLRFQKYPETCCEFTQQRDGQGENILPSLFYLERSHDLVPSL